MNAKRIKNFFTYVGVILLLFVILFPILYIFISSFKPLSELIKSEVGFIIQNPTLENYVSLISDRTPIRNFPLFLFNSLKISICTAFLCVLVGVSGAYGLSRYKYPGGDILARLMLFVYAFPTVLLLIPVYKVFVNLGLFDTHIALIIIYTGISAPFCTWLLISFFKTIPPEMEEAAAIDGATKFTIFLKITFPLMASGIATVAVYAFIVAWGDYVFALILLSSNANRTAPLGLATLTTEQYIEWGPLLAGSILIIIPVLVLFFPVARQFIKGFTGGAVKQ